MYELALSLPRCPCQRGLDGVRTLGLPGGLPWAGWAYCPEPSPLLAWMHVGRELHQMWQGHKPKRSHGACGDPKLHSITSQLTEVNLRLTEFL